MKCSKLNRESCMEGPSAKKYASMGMSKSSSNNEKPKLLKDKKRTLKRL